MYEKLLEELKGMHEHYYFMYFSRATMSTTNNPCLGYWRLSEFGLCMCGVVDGLSPIADWTSRFCQVQMRLHLLRRGTLPPIPSSLHLCPPSVDTRSVGVCHRRELQDLADEHTPKDDFFGAGTMDKRLIKAKLTAIVCVAVVVSLY